MSFNIHMRGVQCINILNNHTFISGSCGSMKIWNICGEIFNSFDETFLEAEVHAIKILNCKYIIGSTADMKIKIWELETYNCIKTLQNDSFVVSILVLNENKFATGDQKGKLKICRGSRRSNRLHIIRVDNRKRLSFAFLIRSGRLLLKTGHLSGHLSRDHCISRRIYHHVWHLYELLAGYIFWFHGVLLRRQCLRI